MRGTDRTVIAAALLAVGAAGCGKTYALTVAKADANRPGYGIVAHDKSFGSFGYILLAAGTAAYVVDAAGDAPQQDVVWRIETGGSSVRFCRSDPKPARCTDVTAEGLSDGSIVVPVDSPRCAGASCATARTVEDAAKPRPARGLWIVGGRQAFYCSVMRDRPSCVVAALEGKPVYVRRALGAHALSRPTPADVVWLERGSASGTFWWGGLAGAEGVVRCQAGNGAPPTCVLAAGAGG